MGLSGLGDRVLTATSPASRNFSFGRMLVQRTPLAALRASDMPQAEGVATAPRALCGVAAAQGVPAVAVVVVLAGSARVAAALSVVSGDHDDGPQIGEGGVEAVGPRPVLGQVQGELSG